MGHGRLETMSMSSISRRHGRSQEQEGMTQWDGGDQKMSLNRVIDVMQGLVQPNAMTGWGISRALDVRGALEFSHEAGI
jgi:hypothetical protein